MQLYTHTNRVVTLQARAGAMPYQRRPPPPQMTSPTHTILSCYMPRRVSTLFKGRPPAGHWHPCTLGSCHTEIPHNPQGLCGNPKTKIHHCSHYPKLASVSPPTMHYYHRRLVTADQPSCPEVGILICELWPWMTSQYYSVGHLVTKKVYKDILELTFSASIGLLVWNRDVINLAISSRKL